MASDAHTCARCETIVAIGERLCAACSNPVDIEFIEVGLAAEGAPESVTSPTKTHSRLAGAVAATVLLAIVSFALIRTDGSSSDSGTASAPTEVAREPQQPSLREATWIAATRLEDHDGLRLAVLDGPTISLVDLATATTVGVEIDLPVGSDRLASVDGHLAFLSQNHAFVISLDGSTVSDFGAADTVLNGSTESSLWIGELDADESDRMHWREVDSTGNPLRTTITALPLDFPQPDLRSGHQSWMLRLTDNDSRPWEMIARGSPVATGSNDLILNACDSDLNCDRRWFDVRTGIDRGPLLADLAENIGDRSGGLISPQGRYWLSGSVEAGPVTLLAISTGEVLENQCTASSTAQWASDDSLLACHADDGAILVYDLSRGAVLRVDELGGAAPSFVFVPG